MSSENWTNVVSAIATGIATLVALGLAIIPPLWARRQGRQLAKRKIVLCLQTIAEVIRNYRYFNPVKYNDGNKEKFAYNPGDLKIDTSIDINRENDTIISSVHLLRVKHQSNILNIAVLIKKISTGYPYGNEDWDNLENLIKSTLEELSD